VTVILDVERTNRQGTLLLSHEFVHALQDQREGLARFYDEYGGPSDAIFALRCLTEGEAVLVSNLTLIEGAGTDAGDVDWEGYFGDWLEQELADVELADAPLYAARALVYPVGGLALATAYRSGGLAAVRGVYRNPPRTFLNWVNLNRGALEPEALDCEPPEPPEGFELKYLDRHGMLGLLSLSVGLGKGAAYDASRAWTADTFAVYTAAEEASEEVAVAWRIRFDTERAAARWASDLASSELPLQAQQQGQELLLTAASSESLLADWSGLDACGNADKSRTSPRPHYRVPRSVARWRELRHAATFLR